MQTAINDTELVLQLRKVDKKAFDCIYQKYHEGVKNVLKLSRDHLVAEEVVQETFVALWEKRKTIDSEKSVAGWFFTVSYNP